MKNLENCEKISQWPWYPSTHLEMTLRDEFAKAALIGLLAQEAVGEPIAEWYSRKAYKIADAMMAERKKGKNEK